MLYYAGERVTISAGTKHGLQIGQRFFVRRPLDVDENPRGEQTAGWLHIVDSARVQLYCRGRFQLRRDRDWRPSGAVRRPAFPRDIDRTNATGTLDFSKSARVLFGNDGRHLAGDRDFVLATPEKNTASRLASIRGVSRLIANHEPNVSFGEAVVVSVSGDKSLLRITEAHDAVRSGDTLVRRDGIVDFSNESEREIPQVAAAAGREGEGSAPPTSIDRRIRMSFTACPSTMWRLISTSTRLKPDTFALLDQAVQVLEQNPTLQIKIEGYSCNIGTAKYNLALGKAPRQCGPRVSDAPWRRREPTDHRELRRVTTEIRQQSQGNTASESSRRTRRQHRALTRERAGPAAASPFVPL